MKSPTRVALVTAITVLVAAALSLAGCAYPSISVRTARLDSVQLSGLTVDVFFDVENPNQFALPLEQVDWTLRLFDMRVGTGTSRMDKNLPAKQTTRVKMPITVSFGDAAGVATKIRGSRSIPWDIDGTAHITAPTGPLALDFGEKGRWDNPIF
jgi:LEA14-like dessication related protein